VDSANDIPEVGPWAADKLTKLGKYLAAYMTIMRKRHWNTVYIDAFAGAGLARVRSDNVETALLDFAGYKDGEEYRRILDGSPKVALDLEHPFTSYVFVELSDTRVAHLEELSSQYPERSVRIRQQDCNEYLRSVVSQVDWSKWRGVVFLDPFGMHVPWSTVELLANTGAVEVIINFPVGMAIQRLLKVSGEFTEQEREKLTDYFGDPGWYELLYRETPTLFGDTLVEKVEHSGDKLVTWYQQRLRDVFGFSPNPHLVRNTRKSPLYYLVFAGPNKTGAKIAGHVLASGTRVST
jgi:three-Cys-motif partner protein